MSDVGWIFSSGDNPSDGLTKDKRCGLLESQLDMGYLHVQAKQWNIWNKWGADVETTGEGDDFWLEDYN